jgi:hypothetical protein
MISPFYTRVSVLGKQNPSLAPFDGGRSDSVVESPGVPIYRQDVHTVFQSAVALQSDIGRELRIGDTTIDEYATIKSPGGDVVRGDSEVLDSV